LQGVALGSLSAEIVMDEKISLALAVKLKLIFENEDQFLSFPLGWGYSYRSLDFMKEQSDLSAAERLQFTADFAEMVNYIPTDGAPVFAPSGQFLWNEIKDILTSATFATSRLSSAEEKQLSEAIGFLTDEQIGPDGTKIPINSKKADAYTSHKINYEQAEAIYLNEKFSVENAVGEERQRLTNIWASGREQQLRSVKEQAMQDWINLGFKNEVERYQMLRNDLEGKKYPILYRQAYLNEIELAESPNPGAKGIPFWLTFFNPRDAFDRSLPWVKVNLNKSEIQSLVQQAPQELKGVFTAGQGNEDIESLALEYNYVGVKRPWFKPEFFSGRYWKMPDDSIVSDGATPRHGRLPAYISAFLAVRNVTVTKRKTGGAPGNVIPILNTIPLQQLRLKKTVPPPHLVVTAPPKPSVQIPVPTNVGRPQPNIRIHSGRVPSAAAMGKSSFVRRAAVPPSTSRKESGAILKRERKVYVNVKYVGTTMVTPRLGPSISTASPITQPSPTVATVTQTYNLDGIAVLAFVCRRVPKVPNPDPNLQW